jgi:hypothetical protein
MFWLVVLPIVLGIGVIVFILTRDSFRASRVSQKTPPAAFPAKSNCNATAINTMMQQTLSAPPPSNPPTLLPEQCDKETEDFSNTLAQLKENPLLIDVPRLYLRLEEDDDRLERMLFRRLPGRGADQISPREFSIGVTEKRESPPKHENSP